jgi:hypothetical protein
MSASTTRPVRHSIPLSLSIVARPHEVGLIRSWRADSLAFVWLDPGITPCCKSLFGMADENLGAADAFCAWLFTSLANAAAIEDTKHLLKRLEE